MAAASQVDAGAALPTAGVWKQARLVNGKTVSLPRVPAKYLKFLRVRGACKIVAASPPLLARPTASLPLQARALVYREIRVMCALGRHENVLALHEVLEMVQVR